jgi:hypothetical protein
LSRTTRAKELAASEEIERAATQSHKALLTELSELLLRPNKIATPIQFVSGEKTVGPSGEPLSEHNLSMVIMRGKKNAIAPQERISQPSTVQNSVMRGISAPHMGAGVS